MTRSPGPYSHPYPSPLAPPPPPPDPLTRDLEDLRHLAIRIARAEAALSNPALAVTTPDGHHPTNEVTLAICRGLGLPCDPSRWPAALHHELTLSYPG